MKADFSRRGVDAGDISSFLQKVLQENPVETGNNAHGLYAEYLTDGKCYTIAYGSYGYVVLFYPSDRPGE